MVPDLMRARINVEICEDILLSSTVGDQQDTSPALKEAYENALKSLKTLYFMMSEAINMEKAHDSRKVDPIEQLITDALKK